MKSSSYIQPDLLYIAIERYEICLNGEKVCIISVALFLKNDKTSHNS